MKENPLYPFEYFIVSILAILGIIFVATLLQNLLNTKFNLLRILADAAFIASIIALIFINLRYMILPNKITYTGFVLAIIVRAFVPNLASFSLLDKSSLADMPVWLLSIIGAFVGAIIGGGLLWLLSFIWERMRGVEILGLGDVKMMFMIGAYLGIAKTLLVLISSFFLMIPLAAVVMIILARRKSDNIQYLLPSGFIWGIPAISMTLFGDAILELLAWQ